MNLERLYEYHLSDFGISEITNRALNKRYSDGNSGLWVKNAILNYPNQLMLIFDAESTYDGDEQVGPSGQSTYSGNKSYEVQIRFNNIGGDISSDFLGLPYSQQKMQLENLFENNDEVKWSCNCPASYWQGFDEKGSKTPRPNVMIYPFSGVYGKDIWANLHRNKHGMNVCKHTFQAIAEIFNFIPDILKILSKGTTVSSSASSAQPVNNIQGVSKPAGQPKNNKELKSNKVDADENSAENLEVTNSNEHTIEEEEGHAPSGDITKVASKDIEADTTAAEGVSPKEPAIEEPELTEESKEHSDEIEDENTENNKL